MTSEQSPLKVAPSPKKLRVSSNLDKCFICQKLSAKLEGFTAPVIQGYYTFINAAILRHGKGDDQIYERLQLYPDATGERVDESHYGSIKWHKSCYCSFTSKKNIPHLTDDVTRDNKPISKEEELDQIRSSRSASGTLDWTKCLLCQQLSYKKDKKLIRVSTFEYEESLEKKANEIGDA